MLRVTSNAGDLAKRMHQSITQLDRTVIKSMNGVTLAGQRFARRIAPRATGALYRGIQRRPVMRQGKVFSSALVSTVNKPFPYQKWVNEDIKTVSLPIAKHHGHWPLGKFRSEWTTQKWRYRDTKHTGVPGYFNLTFRFLQKRFPVELQKGLKRTLKMGGK